MKKGMIIRFLFFWGGFIFYQGSRSTVVSLQISDHIVNQLVIVAQKWLPFISSETLYQLLNVMIRKLAHFIEYAVLGSGLFCYFKSRGQLKINQWIYALFIVLLLATMDEFIQSFVGRTSSVRDVLIDFSGGIGGVSLMAFLMKSMDVSKSILKIDKIIN